MSLSVTFCKWTRGSTAAETRPVRSFLPSNRRAHHPHINHHRHPVFNEMLPSPQSAVQLKYRIDSACSVLLWGLRPDTVHFTLQLPELHQTWTITIRNWWYSHSNSKINWFGCRYSQRCFWDPQSTENKRSQASNIWTFCSAGGSGGIMWQEKLPLVLPLLLWIWWRCLKGALSPPAGPESLQKLKKKTFSATECNEEDQLVQSTSSRCIISNCRS